MGNSRPFNDQSSNNNDSNGNNVHELDGVSSGDKLRNQRSGPGDKCHIEESGIDHYNLEDKWEGSVGAWKVDHSGEGNQRSEEELGEDNHDLSAHEVFREIGNSISIKQFMSSNGSLISILESLIGMFGDIHDADMTSFQ